MITFIKRVVVKLRELNKQPEKPLTIKQRLASNLSIDNTSILKEESSCYFNPHYNRANGTCIKVGKECLITAHFIFETETGEINIGDNVYIGGATLISKSSITIGNNVTMAWGIMLYDHDAHSTDWGERKNDNKRCYNDYLSHNGNLNVTKDWSVVKSKPIIIGDNVWIGFDVLILKGVKVGKGAVIAAKSVVTKDVPAWTLVAGNPAVVVKQLKEYN